MHYCAVQCFSQPNGRLETIVNGPKIKGMVCVCILYYIYTGIYIVQLSHHQHFAPCQKKWTRECYICCNYNNHFYNTVITAQPYCLNTII